MEDDFFPDGGFGPDSAVDRFCLASGRAVMMDEDGSEEIPLIAFHLHHKGGGVTAHVMPLHMVAPFMKGVAEAVQFAVRPDPKAGRPWYRRLDPIQGLGFILVVGIVAAFAVGSVAADGGFTGLIETFNFCVEVVGMLALVTFFRQLGRRSGQRKREKEAMKKAASQVDGSHEAL